MKQVESEFDLPRLSEGGDPALLRAVSGLRENTPDVTELASLASGLAVRGITVTSPEAPPSIGSGAWKKWALGGGAAVAGVGLWWAMREPAPPPPVVPREAPSELSPRAVGFTEPVPSAPRRGPSTSGIGTAVPEPPANVAAPDPATPTASPLAGSPQPSARAATATSEPEPSRAERATRASVGSSTDRPASPEAPSAFTVPTEIALLRDARLALKSSPARALELAESHARTYPNGKLTQERELIAISALVGLGRRTAALSRASRFEQVFPQSPYRKQIGALLQ